MPTPTSAASPSPRPDGGATRGSHWHDDATCFGEDPELFFPVGTNGPAVWQAQEAKTVCRRCPVAAPCLTWALENGVEHGIWGGHTEEERRALRRRRARGRVRRFT